MGFLHIVLIAVGLLLILSALFLCARLSTAQDRSGPSVGTRFFLICLRVAIGWHFLWEGVDKVTSATWSSEAYLRESTGPLAPAFRDLAGDRLIDKLTLGSDGSFPPELELEWQTYVDAVKRYYALNEEQTKRLDTGVEQTKAKVKNWLASRPKRVEIPNPYP